MFYFRLNVLGCLAAALLVACGDTGTPAELIERAEQAMQRGDYRAAMVDLKAALSEQPDLARGRFLLGKAYLEFGEGEAAEKEFKRASDMLGQEPGFRNLVTRALLLQSRYEDIVDQAIGDLTREEDPLGDWPAPIRAELLALRGQAYARLAQPEQARQFFDQALALHPDEPEAKLGLAAMKLAEDPDGARKLIEEVVAKTPDHAAAWSALAEFHLRARALPEAESALSKAIEHSHANSGDRLRRALVRIDLDRADEAQQDINEVRKVLPGYYEADYAQGALLLKQKKYQDAAAAFQAALKSKPEFHRAAYLLGSSLYALGQFEQADAHLKRVVAASPGIVAVRKLRAAVLYRLTDFPGVQEMLEPVVAALPDDLEALDMLANAYLKQGKYKEGNALLDKLVTLSPDSAKARAKLAASLLASGAEAEGLAELSRAQAIDPTLAQTDLTLVAYHLQHKDLDAALKAAEDFRQRHPDSPQPLNAMGMIERLRKEPERARAFHQKALEIAPDDLEARFSLATIAAEAKQYPAAREHYDAALKSHPDQLPLMLALARLDELEGHSDAMRKRLDEIIQKHPSAIQPRVWLARDLYRRGQPEKVALTLGVAAQKTPDNPLAADILGRAQLALRDGAGALVSFGALAKMQPQSAEAQFGLAQAHALLDQRAEALATLDRAIELDTNHFGARLALARVALSERNRERASSHITVLERLSPENPDVLNLKAALANVSGDKSGALRHLSEAFTTNSSESALLALTAQQWSMGEEAEAIAALESWLAKHPDARQVRMSLASAYQRTSNSGKAVEHYRKLLETGAPNAVVMNNLAWELRSERLAEALELAQKAEELMPDVLAFKDTLAILHLLNGDVERARRVSDRIANDARFDSLGPDFRFHRAQILEAGGVRAEATRLLQSALDDSRPFDERRAAEQLLARLNAGG